VKNYKTILIAGAIAVGLYFFLHTKKIIHMTPQQKAAWHEKVSHVMAQMDMAEKIRAVKAARKKKAAAGGTPETETPMTLMERIMAIRAAAEEKLKEAQEEQGTGFDYVREKTHPTPAISAAKKIAEKLGKKIAEEAAKKIAKKLADKKAADEKKRADDKKKAKEALDKLVHDIFNPFYHLGRTEKKTKI